jgi:pyruvate kinase
MIPSQPAVLRRAKIVCTLGPASESVQTIRAMIRAGMDVARLNTSHGTMAHHIEVCSRVRTAAGAENKPVAVLLDLGGPKLRTGDIGESGPVYLANGSTVIVTNGTALTTGDHISIDYPSLYDDVAPGDPILLDDGSVELAVVERSAKGLVCRVVFGGTLAAKRGVSLPATKLAMPSLTERDQEAIRVGVQMNVDFFAQSFVCEAKDLTYARARINQCGGDVPIIAKIERRLAIANLDEVMAEADGAMVARGDLGVELPPEDVPVQQRNIIASAARQKIPVITATQMLESMVNSPRPTRAEASDVANAVWDMSDALMLSGETAIGRYPVEAVEMMDRIIRKAESAPGESVPPAPEAGMDDHSYVIALAARRIVESDPNLKAVVCFTSSGYTAVLMSKVHPAVPIYALSPHEQVVRRLSLARGVIPLRTRLASTADAVFELVDETLLEHRAVDPGEEVLVVAGMPVAAAGTTNFVKLHQVATGR